MKKSSTTGSGGSHYQGSEGVYKVMKLKTGETVLCELAEELKDFSFMPTIDLVNPVLIQYAQMQIQNGAVTGENIIIKPFLSLSSSTVYPISTDVIITMGNMKNPVLKSYLKYTKGMAEQRKEEEADEAIIDLLQSVTPDRPVLIIEHETPMIVEGNAVPPTPE